MRCVCRLAFAVLILLCSCSSSKNPYKKRRKMAPCDCPKFTHVPQIEHDVNEDKTFVFNI
jgi:hypothetical protein